MLLSGRPRANAEHAQIDQHDAADEQRQTDVVPRLERRIEPRDRADRVRDRRIFQPDEKLHGARPRRLSGGACDGAGGRHGVYAMSRPAQTAPNQNTSDVTAIHFVLAVGGGRRHAGRLAEHALPEHGRVEPAEHDQHHLDAEGVALEEIHGVRREQQRAADRVQREPEPGERQQLRACRAAADRACSRARAD